MTKYIFVTGGVVSSLGKGITAASLGRLLKCRGLRVINQKLDPYINVDPGTMSPYQHGEVFVTEDGAETDLDLGHYERFVDEFLSRKHSTTAGAVYSAVLDNERRGDYFGATVQIIPHVTSQIKKIILGAGGDDVDVVISEIGGTVGDIEGLPFIESARQLKRELGKNNCLFIHVTLIPYVSAAGEAKTKPTQHSVKELLSLGIQPEIIVCRSDRALSQNVRDKIALFCNVDKEAVIFNSDTESLYEVPLLLKKEGLDDLVCRYLSLATPAADMDLWAKMVYAHKNPVDTVEIALVGKYVQLHDAYLSLVEALTHGGIDNRLKVNIRWINAEEINRDNAGEMLAGINGIVVPCGFGERGICGKTAAIHHARVNNIPFLGLGLGMQLAVVEFARNVLGLSDAASMETDINTPHPVVFSPHAEDGVRKTHMRLGRYECAIKEGTLAAAVYGTDMISERHRHRYEINNAYISRLKDAGMIASGVNNEHNLVEIIEIPSHRWFVGVQFQPEFKSRPNRPHPLFSGFIAAAYKGKPREGV